jgi:magnesium chelatase family protein
MASKVFSAAIIGLDSQIIEVEADITRGLRRFDIVGLPDKAVEESKERVRSAIKACGYKPPLSQAERILINLAPADLKKEGSLYDLPIALAYLLRGKKIKFDEQRKIFVGELSLDGKLRPIKGALSFALKAKEGGFSEIILPIDNAQEAALSTIESDVGDFKIIGADSLQQIINHLEEKQKIEPFSADFKEMLEDVNYQVCLDWIKGQGYAKRAAVISAAGGHNLLLLGPPGGGKSLLAKALPSILPPLEHKEILEVTKIYSISGLLSKERPIVSQRPFRAAHHTSSRASIIGGGSPLKPGEITLAHRGVLFMDEFPEFHRDVIEALRQPLEDGVITVMRANQRLTFPCQFTLIAAANPCPCGHLNDPLHSCICTSSQIAKYRRKLSSPIIDRIDMTIELPQVEFEKLTSTIESEETSEKKREVILARRVQKQRFQNNEENILTNSEMEVPQIKKYCQIDLAGKNILKKCVDSGELSARGYHRVLKVSRTIADLEQSTEILVEHINEALMYRLKQK